MVNIFIVMLLALATLVQGTNGYAVLPHQARSAFTRNSLGVLNSAIGGRSMTMRDVSASYWFRVGDSVQVVEDVYKASDNLKGQVGTVLATWEKCDVDPTCCCAEQVDIGMSVKVQFEGSGDGEALEHYFAESELIKVESN
jgi:hypothetical protein